MVISLFNHRLLLHTVDFFSWKRLGVHLVHLTKLIWAGQGLCVLCFWKDLYSRSPTLEKFFIAVHFKLYFALNFLDKSTCTWYLILKVYLCYHNCIVICRKKYTFFYFPEKNNKQTRTRTIAHFTFYLATAFWKAILRAFSHITFQTHNHHSEGMVKF